MTPSRMMAAARHGSPLVAALCLMLWGAAWATPAYADPAPDRAAASSVFGDSASIPCAPGTTDLGVHDGYHSMIRARIRLCAVDNLTGTRSESIPSSPYYIRNGKVGANGHAVVNSRVSGPVQRMVRDMKAAGLTVSAFSSYRSMRHQQDLCAADPRCKAHTYHYLAEPGTSNHQMGLAIDFTMPMLKSQGTSCAAPATEPGNSVWRWLEANAARYGFKQYSAEPWHWEAAGANSC